MSAKPDFGSRVTIDLVLLGVAGGLTLWAILGANAGWSFLAGSLWIALNFLILTWLLEAVVRSKRTSKLFIFIIVCAKIPALYFVLYRLYTVGYLDAIGLTAGLVLLPVVLLFRGLS